MLWPLIDVNGFGVQGIDHIRLLVAAVNIKQSIIFRILYDYVIRRLQPVIAK
jgi:hypothetical protein